MSSILSRFILKLKEMNKILAIVGYLILKPISLFAALIKCRMSLKKAEEILKEVYDLEGKNYNFTGGQTSHLQPNQIELSFIIPVYNSESFIERCVISICSQNTNVLYEVICVNDGSTDNSLQLLNDLQKKYQDKLIIVSQENRGISATRNRGLEMARGEYVGFIDNDDFVSDNYIETLWNCRRHTNSDIIQMGHKYVDVNGIYIGEDTNDNVYNVKNKHEIMRYLKGYLWSGIIRKSLFIDVRLPLGFWYEDMITCMLLFRLCKSYSFIKDCLYNKTEHLTNASKILWGRKSYRCIDQYYLMFHLAEYGCTHFSLPKDDILFTLLQNELYFLWNRTNGIARKYRKAIFILSAYQLDEYRPNYYHYKSGFQKMVDKDFLQRNYWKWEIDGYLEKCISKITH